MSKNLISKEDVKKLSILSNLEVTGSQEDKLSDMLSDTLNYIETLDKLDTSGVEETFQVTGLKNIFQTENKGSSTLEKEKALSNSKNVVDGLFHTKAVFDR